MKFDQMYSNSSSHEKIKEALDKATLIQKLKQNEKKKIRYEKI